MSKTKIGVAVDEEVKREMQSTAMGTGEPEGDLWTLAGRLFLKMGRRKIADMVKADKERRLDAWIADEQVAERAVAVADDAAPAAQRHEQRRSTRKREAG